MNVIGRGVQHFYPMRSKITSEWPLSVFNHSAGWVKTKPTELANFKRQGLPAPEYRSRIPALIGSYSIDIH